MSQIQSSTPESELEWRYEPESIAKILEEAGFDLDSAPTRLRHGGGITARLVRETRTFFIAVDAGGRVRATIQTDAGESTHTVSIPAGPTLTAVRRETREETLTGRVRSTRDVAAIVAHLCHVGRIAASDTGASLPE